MSRFRRLAVWLVPLVVTGLGSLALPGRAQQAASSRYAFADTLLLRDTLGLDFSQLYPTADSLSVIPDSLRAWMIRWRLQIPRLLVLSDSLGEPVGNVGPTLERERLSALAAGRRAAPATSFQYGATYDVMQTTNTWTNTSRFTYSNGPAVFNNDLQIRLQRTTSGGKLTLAQERRTSPRLDWSISKGQSLGAVAELYKTLDHTQGLGTTGSLSRGNFSLSGRSKTAPARHLTSDFTFLSGYGRDDNSSALKRALTGEANERLRYNVSGFTSDLSGKLTGNKALTRQRTGLVDQNTHDYSHDVNGTMTLLQNSPVGFVGNFKLSRSRYQTPSSDTTIRTIATGNNSLDGTIKARRDNERYLALNTNIRNTQQTNGDRTDRSGGATLRWLLMGWGIDASYRDRRGLATYPRSGSVGGYDERSVGRSADATATRQFGRINAKLNASIGLDRLRYKDTAAGATHSADRDNYRQSYRMEGRFQNGRGISNDLALEVGLTSLINIPGSATSTNTDTRSYRAEWRWSYQLLEGVTANQTNSIAAEYRSYPFAHQRDDLALDYNSSTSLNAVLTPRLSLQLLHNYRQQPKGSYQLQRDGVYYLLPTDEGRNYSLSTSINYALSPDLSLSVSPSYSEISRFGNQNGVYVPQRRSGSLDVSGRAHLNKAIGKALLTGDIGRQIRSDRTTTYQSGVPDVSPRSEQSYWSGSLAFTWNL